MSINLLISDLPCLRSVADIKLNKNNLLYILKSVRVSVSVCVSVCKSPQRLLNAGTQKVEKGTKKREKKITEGT